MSRTTSTIALAAALVGATILPTPATSATQPQHHPAPAGSTKIQPGELDRGHRPRALHQRGRTIVDRGRTVRVAGPEGLRLVGKGSGGYLMVRYGAYHGRLWRIRPGHDPRRVGIVPDAGYNGGGEAYAISASARRFAYSVPDRGGSDYLYVRGLPSGDRIRGSVPMNQFSRILDYRDGRMILASGGTYSYRPSTDDTRRITESTASAVGGAADRMVVWDRQDQRHRLVALRDPSDRLGSWRRGRALAFSPDGLHLLTRAGPDVVDVRSADDGHRIHRFHAATRIAPTARWESDRRILLTVRGHEVAAGVRCGLRGSCERTTPLATKIGDLSIDWPLAPA